jgi:FkbM family methyltransferase
LGAAEQYGNVVNNMHRLAKDLTKHAVRVVLSALSGNALDTLLDELRVVLRTDYARRRSRFRLLSRLAADSHVVALKVGGDYGVMQSAAADSHILFRYSEEHRFADRTNKLMAEFFGVGPGSYIDVGANIGMTVVPIARNPLVQCQAFEPEPTNFVNLLANIGANCPHQNVVAKQIALFSEAGQLCFELASGNLGDHRIRLNDGVGRLGEDQRRTIEVQARPLDEAVSELRPPVAIKIDTQGAEPYVFAGGRNVIACADLLISEFWPYGMHRMGGNVGEISDQLVAFFGTISIAEAEEGDLSGPIAVPTGCEKLAELYRQHADDPDWYCDIVARK